MNRTCKQCGKPFVLTDSEIEFFESKGLELPKRCEDCRKKNREAKGKTGGTAKVDEQNATRTSSEAARTTKPSVASSKPANGKSLSSKVIGGVAAVVVAVAVGVFGIGGTNDQPADNQPAVTHVASAESANVATQQAAAENDTLKFRKKSLRNDHFEKHGKEMGFATAQEYVSAANAVVANPDSLHKVEAEDGDDVYYLESTDEIVFMSPDGYIRTYFNPEGRDYFDRQ